ncbi:uncharacterized protein LOC143028508 [Oratosquilla oratoria]|uniref:uncharacterized protein LOC143028508 n=1 Tax=Oratosquilla oratoria TaxID=337810 RepID=UPI003F7673E2
MKSRGEGTGGALGVTAVMVVAAVMLMVTMMVEGAIGQNTTRPVIAIRNMSYPLLDGVPITDFRCNDRPAGYYADPEAGCQLYHMCDTLGKQYSYLCPNYTLFNQKVMVCDHWYMVNCSDAPDFYDLNSHIGKIPLQVPLVENGIELESTVPALISPTVSTFTFAGSKGNTSTKRSSLQSLSPSTASSSPSSPAPSPLSFFKSSPFSLKASTSIPSAPSPSVTPISFPPSSSSSPSAAPSESPFSSSSSIPSTPPPTSPFTRPSTLLKPLDLIAVSPLSPKSTSSSFPPLSTSSSFPPLSTTASPPQSSLLQRATVPTPRPVFPPPLPTNSPSSSLNHLSRTPTHSTSLLTPLSSNSSLVTPSSSSTLPLPSSSPTSNLSVPENLNSPSLLARGKGEDRPLFGIFSTTTSTPSPIKPSISPHLQSVAFALKPEKPNKNDLSGVVLRPVLVRLNKNDSNEVTSTMFLPLEITAASSADTDTTTIPSTDFTPPTILVPPTTSLPEKANPLPLHFVLNRLLQPPVHPFTSAVNPPHRELVPPTVSLPETANPLPVHFMLNRELQPPLHPFKSTVNPPSQFLTPPVLFQPAHLHLSLPSGRIPNKSALSTNKKQEALTPLSPLLSTRRGPRLLPNTTSFRFTSFRPNRDFFIPTANFPMPPLEEDHSFHEGLMIQKVLSAAHVSHNGVDDPDQDDHPHMFHMTMVFPVMMGAQRFNSLKLNPECPHCHPAFLKPDQCNPCVIIK